MQTIVCVSRKTHQFISRMGGGSGINFKSNGYHRVMESWR